MLLSYNLTMSGPSKRTVSAPVIPEIPDIPGVVLCGNCKLPGHRCEGCPDVCFACGEDHCYLDCPSAAARVRARQNRATWRGGVSGQKESADKKTRKGSNWVRQPYDPGNGEPTPEKKARMEAKQSGFRSWVSLLSLLTMDDAELGEYLASVKFLLKPGFCPDCETDPFCQKDGSRLNWTCSRHCRKVRCNVFKDCYLVKERTRLSIKEFAALVWCWVHEVSTKDCALVTGLAHSSVKPHYAKIRELVSDKQRASQAITVFSSDGLVEGYCHLQADATRVKKKHTRDADGRILETTHCGAVVITQRGSLKAVVYPMEPVDVKVGSDGKPGAVPPETDAFIHSCLAPHIGKGVLVNSDGGSGGDGMHDHGLSQSPITRKTK